MELENLDINDDALELDCGDEAEDLTKKLLDEQGKKNLRFVFLTDLGFLFLKLVVLVCGFVECIQGNLFLCLFIYL